jgi:hypothetical protein
LFQIDAGAESATDSSDQHQPDGRVIPNRLGHSIQVTRALMIHRVEHERAVQAQIPDSPVRLEIHGLEFHTKFLQGPPVHQAHRFPLSAL